MQGFQFEWENQRTLSIAQLDMTTACLLHFNLSLPAMARWIGGPHVAEHRVNSEILARLKRMCDEENFNKGSPTCVNAECSQESCRAPREHGNHSTIANNPAMVTKTLLKEVKRGCSLMLDPDIMDFLENCKQTPHGVLHLEHRCESPRMTCDSTCRPQHWCMAINDWTNEKNEPALIFATLFVATLAWMWNLRTRHPWLEICICDDNVTNAFKQIKHPPNLAGLHCKVIDGMLCVDAGQTFGDCTAPPNWESIATCRSQQVRALWFRNDTVSLGLPLSPTIEH
jgi:hypothetical protein